MPHIVVKLWPGRNDDIKLALAKQVAQDVANGLKIDIGDFCSF